jgi:putative phosphoribosyl transferase
MKFRDRYDASMQLLQKLAPYKGQNPLVLGIPRGAVPMAEVLAEGLEGELGAVLVHKIPAPGNEEFAIGSIGLSGQIQRMPHLASLGIPETYVQEAAKNQLALLQTRKQRYGLADYQFKNRIVIIVDDGIATGATTLSAVREIKAQNPGKIVVATPVASLDSAKKVAEEVDEFVVIDIPPVFYAVGQFYEDFGQVSDEEVIECLQRGKGISKDNHDR